MKKDKIEQNSIIESPLEEIFGDRFGRYSKYIIQDRALPDVRDGLKPVQRRILYAMHVDGNTSEKPHRKSAKTVGLVIGNYHPHGDSSVYDAMVRMSQGWKMNVPLVDMHGNNGSIDNDPAAAMRYTEARLSAISSLLLKDIDQNTVEFAPNFDDSDQEPTVLPASFPNLLVNGTTGISAGYATNIPPHNLHEVIDAAILRISNPNCSLNDIMQIVKGPDFPTGGIVQGRSGIKEAFKTGRGRVIVRSVSEIVETKSLNQIVVTQIPYEVVKSTLVKQIDDIRLDKDNHGILDVRDESDRNGLKIVIDVRKEQDANVILNYLLKKTQLQVSFNYNMVGIVDRRPKQLGILDILDAYIEHRRTVVLNRSRYQLAKIEERCHILQGLIKAVSIMDEIIAIIRRSKDKSDAKKRLIDAFDFTEVQAEAIVTLRLYRLTSTDITELKEEYAALLKQMEIIKAILKDNDILNQVLIRELRDVKETFGAKRKSEIQQDVEEIVIDKQSMVVNERVMLTLSKDGYVKRVSMRSFNASEGLTGIKESDELIGALEVDTIDFLLGITSLGNYFYVPVHEIDEGRWRDIGSHLSNLTTINGNEKIIDAYISKSLFTEAWLVSVSADGMIKRTMIRDLEPQRFNRTYALMNLRKNDVVVSTAIVYEGDELIVATQNGLVARYGLDQVPITSLRTLGVKTMNMEKGDKIASLVAIRPETDTLIVVNDKSGIKRIWLNEINAYNRPVKGDQLFNRKKSNPLYTRYLVATKTYDEMLFINGGMHPIVSKDVALMTRDSTFSNPLVFDDGWYLVRGIEEIRIVDVPEEDVSTSEAQKKINDDECKGDVEFISLDV